MNSEWLVGMERRQAALQKWDTPVLSGAEVTLRSSNLTQNSTKILSEPRPKPPEPEKKDEKDGKTKKKKGEKSSEEEKKDDKGMEKETEVEGIAASGGVNGKTDVKPEAPKRPKWQLFLAGGFTLLLLGSVGGVLVGLGEPYGWSSPIASWFAPGGDVDFEDMPLADAVEPADASE